MNKPWVSNAVAILGKAIPLFLCLAWVAGAGLSESVGAASFQPVPPIAAGPLVPPGKAAPPEARTASSPASMGWLIECADCPKHFSDMSDRSFRLDTAGRARIAYGAEHLYYAWFDGAAWHAETVDEAPAVGAYASLALDVGGYPHISYYDNANDDLKYAYRDASGWHIQTVDSEGDVGKATSLALDGAGWPHISYRDITEAHLKYAFRDAFGWHIEMVGAATGLTTSLALDENGIPHVSYNNYESPYLWVKYARRSADGSWIRAYVSGVSGAQGWTFQTSLALDGDGYPHISYFIGYSHELVYSKKDASGWHHHTVASALDGGDNSLAIDGNGHAHISYWDYNDYVSTKLQYTYEDASGWHTLIVDDGGGGGYVGSNNSLALDVDGYPHISYYDLRKDLKYAYQDASGWHVQVTDSNGQVGQYTSLALGDDGYPHISYYDYANWDLKYSYQDSSGWHSLTVDDGGVLGGMPGDVGQYTSLALDGSGYPHISYFSYNYQSLKYAYQDASGWHKQTVDDDAYEGSNTSVALDENGYAHISYRDYFDGLKYAYQDGSGWNIHTVDSGLYLGLYTSLALDVDAYPRISYYDSSNDDLKYAYQDASGWHKKTVDSEGDVGRGTSLALDGGGYPHISYYDSANDDLKYAYEDASGWHTLIVDDGSCGGYVGSNTSLALDVDAYPYISYYDSANSDLKHAYQDAAGWNIQTVDNGGSVGHYTSLALDENGYPRISYWDASAGDLMYVAWVEVPAPVASFTGSPTSGFAPLSVVFTNTSTGYYTSSLWDFGDGQTSTLRNPSHIYEAAGTFTVTLTVSGSGGMDTLTRLNYVTAYAEEQNTVYLPLILRNR
jgi:hypothetical protein